MIESPSGMMRTTGAAMSSVAVQTRCFMSPSSSMENVPGERMAVQADGKPVIATSSTPRLPASPRLGAESRRTDPCQSSATGKLEI